jgi:hypothetical protein
MPLDGLSKPHDKEAAGIAFGLGAYLDKRAVESQVHG